MSAELWTVLAREQPAQQIADVLQNGVDVPVIQGPPGSGKSSFAKQIGGMWEEGGGVSIVALGDKSSSDVDYYPFGVALSPLTKEWRKLARELTPAAESLVLGTGGQIVALVRALAGLGRRTRNAKRQLLDERAQRILFDLERVSRKKPLLLIADNLHWWDRASLRLIAKLLEPQMHDSFSFLSRVRILAVQTPPPMQEIAHPEAHASLLRLDRTRYFDLECPSREQFGRVLAGLGAPASLDPEASSLVYRLTGGHLALAKRCAQRLAEDEGDYGRFLAQLDSGDFVRRLLTERIETLGPLGQEAVRLLQTAAVLGLSFRRDEIVCASETSDGSIGELLRFCRSQDVLEVDHAGVRFVHDLYREHFLNARDFDQVAVHERLGICFRELRPADYQLRSENALKAEKPIEAANFALQALISAHRNGQDRSALRPIVLAALSKSTLAQVGEDMVAAIYQIDAANPDAAIRILSTLPHSAPVAIKAEADLLRASALLLTRSGTDRRRALSILERWSSANLGEPDLEARLLRAQFYGRALELDKGAALALEDQLRTLLELRAAVDPSAIDDLYILDRCAAAVHEPEVARPNVQRAVDHFAPGGSETIRRPTQYYFALTNLAAEHILIGEFEQAREVFNVINRLVEDFEPGTFKKLEFALSNQLLAEFRLGIVDSTTAAQRQNEIVSAHASEDDPFYPGNAWAVYEAFSGKMERSIEILDSLLETLSSRRHPEASMLYVLRANRAAIRFVGGDREGVLEEWHRLSAVVREITYPIAGFYIRRHDLLLDVISEGNVWTMQSFDTCLTADRRSEIGPQWEQLGRGFRLPEVMWWL